MSCKVVNLRTPIQVRVTPPRRRKVDNPFCVTAALDSGRFHEVEYNVPAVLGNDGAIQNSTDMAVRTAIHGDGIASGIAGMNSSNTRARGNRHNMRCVPYRSGPNIRRICTDHPAS